MADIQKGYTFANGEIVTPAKLHTLVDDAIVADSSITTAKLANSIVTTAKIADANVTTAKIADAAVTSAKIADGTIVDADISATAAIADTKLAQITTVGKVLPAAVQGTAVITTDSRLSDARTPVSHTHDDRYYTETEIDNKLAGLPVSGHTHAASAITSGTLDIARIPTGTGSTQVALGNHTHSAATTSAAGFLSATDKTKLDGIAAGAEVNVQADWTATSGDAAILNKPTLGTAAASAATDFAAANHTHSAATTSAAGFLSAADKTKLDAATNANTGNTIVARDASGNFSAGSITASSATSSFGAVRVGRGSGNDATNTALGGGAPLSSITNGLNNVAIGYDSQKLTTSGDRNVSVGQEALFNNSAGSSNVAIGTVAGNKNTGSLNTAVGDSAAYNNTGVGNTALGAYALNAHTTANNSTAIGYSAGSTGNFTNATSLGYTADVTANNQVQLGNSSTTTFAYGAVQNRSDARDKTDIRPTVLGLDFIKAIEPVDYKWDFREDYRPAPPQAPGLNATQAELDEYAAAKAKYLEDIKFSNLTADGTHKRTRYHHGVIAQQVQQVIEASGIDFGGFQDHKIKGGDDVLSVGYLEFIAPLIKAVQELAARVAALESK